MITLWPNLEREDGLETVLEVPIPEEMFATNSQTSWRTIRSWLTRPHERRRSLDFERRAVEIQSLLGVMGAPLLPLPVSSHWNLNQHKIKGYPIEKSMASYIVRQYIAAAGGEHALNSIESLCVVGKVKMAASEFVGGEELSIRKMKNMTLQGEGELGGFVLWQKRPNLWSLELMVSGVKIAAGCDGRVAWRQIPTKPSRAAPPRPLRRSLQGLDPRSIADLFSTSICTGEKAIDGEDCFVLKVEAEASAATARSSRVEIMKHTVWGCFSQRTGLLVHLQDSHSQRIKSPINEVIWETKMESLILDYRTIDGVNIAHGGRTIVSSFVFGDGAEGRTRTRMEEIWSIEEVDFNVKGLSTDCFLPPEELKREDEEDGCDAADKGLFRYRVSDSCSRICASRSGRKVVAVDEGSLEVYDSDDER